MVLEPLQHLVHNIRVFSTQLHRLRGVVHHIVQLDLARGRDQVVREAEVQTLRVLLGVERENSASYKP